MCIDFKRVSQTCTKSIKQSKTPWYKYKGMESFQSEVHTISRFFSEHSEVCTQSR